MTKKCKVLITEDDAEDATFLQQALLQQSFKGDIELLANGRLLMDKLAILKAANALPELIILDLNMPLKSGMEVLNDVNNDPDYRTIPIAVVTASLRKEDEAYCGSKGCQLYLRKPLRFNEYSRMAAQILSLMRQRFNYC